MFSRRFWFILLLIGVVTAGVPSAVVAGGGAVANGSRLTAQSAECAQLAWYAGQLEAAGERIDQQESSIASDNLETWTDADYDAAIALYGQILNELDSLTPPPNAAAFQQALRDGVALYQEALGVMKTQGPFAIFAYFDQFDALTQTMASEALTLEESCGVALYDNDGDGEAEIGPGVATPEAGDETLPADEASPVTAIPTETPMPSLAGIARDGRPIVPLGTTVQLNDAFSLTIVSVDQNDADAVPDPAPDGYQYVTVEMKLGHLREQTDTFELGTLLAVGLAGSIYSATGNSCGIVDGPLVSGDYTGTMTMTGHVCFVVNARDIPGLMLFDQTQPPEVRTYLSLDPALG